MKRRQKLETVVLKPGTWAGKKWSCVIDFGVIAFVIFLIKDPTQRKSAVSKNIDHKICLIQKCKIIKVESS